MGKATIISGGKGGLYTVDLQYNLDRIKASIVKLNEQKAEIQAAIDKIELTEDHSGIPPLELQKAAIQKSLDRLEAIPEKKRVSAWCADFTEDLTGDVGTVEVPDDPAGSVNIVPNGPTEDQSAYVPARDGILKPIMGMGPANAWFNRAIMPAVQKYKPMYRYGTITAINGDRCDVDLFAAPDVNGQSVNQVESLSSVIIQYMSCDAWRFDVGDEVLVSLNRGQTEPKVIGYKSNPKPCDGQVLYLAVNGSACVWDPFAEAFATDIPDGQGGFLTFPCPAVDLDYWLGNTSKAEKPDEPLWGDSYGNPAPVVSGGFSYPEGTLNKGLLERQRNHCQGKAKDTSTRDHKQWRVYDYSDPHLDYYPEGYAKYDYRQHESTDRHETWAAGMPVHANIDWFIYRLLSMEYDTNPVLVNYWVESAEGTEYFPHGYCYEARKPGFESCYFGLATTTDLVWEDNTFVPFTGPDIYPHIGRDHYDDSTFTLTGRFNTPIDPDPVVTTVSNSFSSAEDYETICNEVDGINVCYKVTWEMPDFTAGSAGYPAFTTIAVAGEIAYSKKAIVQVYASVLQACERLPTGGGYTEETYGEYVRAGSVSVETFETDIESEGYDPNGAPQTAELSNFVQNAITDATTPPIITADFYSWHSAK